MMPFYWHITEPDMPQDKIDALIDLRNNGYKIPGRHPGYVKYNEPEGDNQ